MKSFLSISNFSKQRGLFRTSEPESWNCDRALLAAIAIKPRKESMLSYRVNTVIWVSAYAGIVALDDRSFVSLGVLAAVLSGAWWLGRKIQSLEDGLNEMRRHFLDCDQHPRKSHGGEDST